MLSEGEWQSTVYMNDTFVLPVNLLASVDSAVGDWTVDVSGAQDLSGLGNAVLPLSHAHQLTIQASPPTITSHHIDRGSRHDPTTNYVNTRTVTLSGERADNTSLWINGEERLPQGSGAWSIDLPLSRGLSSWRITSQDEHGEDSATVVVHFYLDQQAPRRASSVPDNLQSLNTVPETLSISLGESGSGFDRTTLSTQWQRDGVPFDYTVTDSFGTWTFTPTLPLIDGNYQLNMTVADRSGNVANTGFVFTLDTVAPTPLQIDAYPQVTNSRLVTLTGTKSRVPASLLMANVLRPLIMLRHGLMRLT